MVVCRVVIGERVEREFGWDSSPSRTEANSCQNITRRHSDESGWFIRSGVACGRGIRLIFFRKARLVWWNPHWIAPVGVWRNWNMIHVRVRFSFFRGELLKSERGRCSWRPRLLVRHDACVTCQDNPTGRLPDAHHSLPETALPFTA